MFNAAVDVYGEIVTYRLRQEDPGLLDSTKYVFQVPKSMAAELLDRIVRDGKTMKLCRWTILEWLSCKAPSGG